MVMKKETTNITTYVNEEFRPFSVLPLSEVDLACFAKLSYFNFGVFLPDFNSERTLVSFYQLNKISSFLDIPGKNDEDRDFVLGMIGNPRFQNIKVFGFRSVFSKEETEQFAAVSFQLEDSRIILAFRGTDSSWVGWKEDFEMATKAPIPAQTRASLYLNDIFRKFRFKKNRFTLVGHSKGGNLAFYSYLTFKEKFKKRIDQVVSLDGPGLNQDLRRKLSYQDNRAKLYKLVPEESIIGQIYDTDYKAHIIQSDAVLLLQHSLYSWKVVNDSFLTGVMKDSVAQTAKTLNDWIEQSSGDEKDLLIETLFSLVSGTDIKTMADLGRHKIQSFFKIYKQIQKLDPKTKKAFTSLLKKTYRYFKDFSKVRPESDIDEDRFLSDSRETD